MPVTNADAPAVADERREDLYSTRDVARLFEIPESRLRYWAQTGFIRPSRRIGERVLYDFRDLISVKVAKSTWASTGPAGPSQATSRMRRSSSSARP